MANRRNSAQMQLFTREQRKLISRRDHGGRLSEGRRKTARPMTPRLPLHVTLKATRARGELSLLRPKHEKAIKRLLAAYSKRFHVQIMQRGNSGNHLHLLVRAKTREGFQNFLRALSGMIARTITGAQKSQSKGKFWDGLAFSRMVTWGRELRNVDFYVMMNELEGLGIWNRAFNRARVAPG